MKPSAKQARPLSSRAPRSRSTSISRPARKEQRRQADRGEELDRQAGVGDVEHLGADDDAADQLQHDRRHEQPRDQLAQDRRQKGDHRHNHEAEIGH
jgi:hypothetical protein